MSDAEAGITPEVNRITKIIVRVRIVTMSLALKSDCCSILMIIAP
jgi:hypothetical protein